MNTSWTLESVTRRLTDDYPLIASGLVANRLDSNDALWPWAERALAHAHAVCGDGDERFDSALEAFAITSLDFMRLQSRFLRTGRYACSQADELGELYADPARMLEYLDGLALTYAMWPNHTQMLRYYADFFLTRLPDSPAVLEIGPGHGLLAALLFEHRPDATYVGVDISASSLEYTGNALRAAGVDPARRTLVHGDATSDQVTEELVGPFDAIVCCEVLEHVDQPEIILDAIRRRLRPDGLAFISTVANLEAVDHVYLYNDLAHIRSMVAACNLTVVDDQPLTLPGAEAQTPLPLNYSGVLSLGVNT